jgi:putative colanic acid biosynthesis acetyltransferase WcaB
MEKSSARDRRVVRVGDLWPTLRKDLAANPRDPKAILILTGFRITQSVMGDLDHPRVAAYPLIAMYRLFTEFLLGVELRPKTTVGAGLTIFHGTGLVVNDHAVIGRGVVLRNGVTIGHRHAHGGSPVLADHVIVGASALILGEVRIGEGAVVGAGAVVVKDVAPYTSVAGNPARKLSDLPRPPSPE